MKFYVDFDGVIMDTETHLFDDYERLLKSGIVKDDREYMNQFDWERHLENSDVIADSIEILKRVKLDVSILGKICTLHEKEAKLKLLRKHDFNKPIIFVPFDSKKCDVVEAKGNILIDDTIHNLVDWENALGLPIYFNKDECLVDPWGNKNNKYKMVKTLELLYKYEEKNGN